MASRRWFKVQSWHIVQGVNQGKGESVMITALCGLKKYSVVSPPMPYSFPEDEKTCENCLRKGA